MKKLVLVLFLLLVVNIVYAGELKVTDEHPFYINGNWIEANQLQVGDLLTTIDGKKVRITGMEQVIDNVLVYNLEDDIFHNYAADNVIVHNSGAVSSASIAKTTLNIELTGRCNAACTTCPRNFAPKTDMSLETFSKVLARAAEDATTNKKITVVTLAGRGEPTLHPDFLKIMSMIREFKANHPDIKFSMVTNAQELTPEKVTAINGVIDELKISTGSTIPEHYRLIQRGLDYETVFRNIENAFRTLTNTKKTIHVTPTQYTKTDLPQLAEYYRNLDPDVNIVVFPFTSNRAGSLTSNLFLDPDETAIAKIVSDLGLSRLEGQFPIPPAQHLLQAFLGQRCLNPSTCLPVDASGNYHFCINDWYGITADSMGNVQRSSIIEALGKREVFASQNKFEDLCTNCNVKQNLQGFNLVKTAFNSFYTGLKAKLNSVFESDSGCGSGW